MRVAAIDIGTNSVHLVVAEVGADGTIEVIEKQRAQVMLGSGGIGQQRIADDAFERGLEALRTFAAAAQSLDAIDVHAGATSAVREAANGAEFCRRVKEATGVHVRVLSGIEEGRLIWLGAKSDLDHSRGPALLCDLGGGSCELILSDATGLRDVRSLPIGHIRLADRFHHSDPLDPDERRAMKKHVRSMLAPVVRRLSDERVASIVGTSGTIRCLARMATLRRGEALPEHAQGLVLHKREVEGFIDDFQRLDRDALLELPGMDPRRAATLPAGAVVVREILKAFDLPMLSTSERSLRDGLIVDWVGRHRPEIDLSATIADPRERSVRVAMDRFVPDIPHAEHVTALALSLYDQLDGVHTLSLADRDLLRAAGLLHDMGHHIAGKGHHKHGQYLLRHIRMYGFTAPDVAVMAAVVRYHARSSPKGSHREWRALSKDDRQRVRVLAGILKIAEALDRSHDQPIRSVEATDDGRTVTVVAHARGDGDMERWAAGERTKLLGQALRREVVVDVRGEDDRVDGDPA